MHSGWYQSSRMFLRGYTTRINRLPTLRSSMLTKLAIVSSFTYCFLQKYIFDRRLFQIILFLPLLCIANTKRSSRSFLQFLVDRREKAWYYTTFILPSLFYFSFSFSLLPIFFLFFLFYFFLFQIPCRYRGGIRVSRWFIWKRSMDAAGSAPNSFVFAPTLWTCHAEPSLPPSPFPMMLLAVKTNFAPPMRTLICIRLSRIERILRSIIRFQLPRIDQNRSPTTISFRDSLLTRSAIAIEKWMYKSQKNFELWGYEIRRSLLYILYILEKYIRWIEVFQCENFQHCCYCIHQATPPRGVFNFQIN